MRIVVSELGTLGRRTGVGHYTSELLRGLRQQAPGSVESYPRGWLRHIKDAARTIVSEAAKLGSSAAPIQTAAGEFQQSGDLKSARAAFGRLGDAIITYARTSNVSIGSGVKVAYCPMARKYWLQRATTIQNPYYGSRMLTCGSFKK